MRNWYVAGEGKKFDEETGTGYKWNTKASRWDYWEDNKYQNPLVNTFKDAVGAVGWVGKKLKPAWDLMVEGQARKVETDLMLIKANQNNLRLLQAEIQNMGDRFTYDTDEPITIYQKKQRDQVERNNRINNALIKDNNRRAGEF